MSKRIGIRHVRMHRFNDTAISRAHRPYAVRISFEPVLYLGRAQACHRKYGNALSTAIQRGIHTFEHFRTIGSGHAAIQYGFIILVAHILNGTIGNKTDIFRIESMVNHRKNDIQVPFTPVLPHHA